MSRNKLSISESPMRLGSAKWLRSLKVRVLKKYINRLQRYVNNGEVFTSPLCHRAIDPEIVSANLEYAKEVLMSRTSGESIGWRKHYSPIRRGHD